MKPDLPAPLLLITDRRSVRHGPKGAQDSGVDAASRLREVVRAALEAGCRWVLLREKDLAADELARLAGELLPLVEAGSPRGHPQAGPRGASARLSVSGAGEVPAGIDAIHLPQGRSVAGARARFGRDALIGVSAHTLAEARAAAEAGADYLTWSPVFASISKPGYGPGAWDARTPMVSGALSPDPLADAGLADLAAACASLPIPIVALGGVTAENCRACLAAGAAGVAVMGAVMQARDPGAVVRSLLARLAPSAGDTERPGAPQRHESFLEEHQ